MYMRVLIAETWRRRRFIPMLHAVFLLVYAGLFVLWSLPDAMRVGECIYILSGLLLPVSLSAGIFGSDISSGRFRTLVTEPVPLWGFYVARVSGLVIQGILHLCVLGAAVTAFHIATGRGNLEHIGLWMLCTGLLYTATAAISTTASIVIPAEANTLAAAMVLVLVSSLEAARHTLHIPWLVKVLEALLSAIRYSLPPVELLHHLADKGGTWHATAGYAFHVLGLLIVYGLVGLLLLEHREYKPQRR